jgi:chromosome segregation ATPase
MRDGISYEDVARIAGKLREQGIKPTVRLIRGELGTGSHGTISGHLATWRKQEDAKADSSYVDLLSSNLKNAIASEIQQTILKAKEDYQGKIDELETHLEQSSSEMLRLESQHSQDEEEKARLKAELESLKQRISEGESERAKLKDQLDKATQQVSHAQIEAAQAKVKLETIMDTHKKMLEDNQRLNEEVKSLAKELAKAERERAVAEARLEEVRSKK